MGLKHGTAVSACSKVRELCLTQEKIGAMAPSQVAVLYYARKNAAKAIAGQEKIMPDLTLLQEKWQMTRSQGSMPRDRKLALTIRFMHLSKQQPTRPKLAAKQARTTALRGY